MKLQALLYLRLCTPANKVTFTGSVQHLFLASHLGAIQVLRNADEMGWWASNFPGNKHYESVVFNVISVTRGWVGVQIP